MGLEVAERRRIDDAVDVLLRYNKSPFITDFLRSQPPPRISPARYEKDELRLLIKQVLSGEYRGRKKYKLRLDGLIEHLDRLQETGRQHLYLLHFAGDASPLLARLRDPAETRNILGVPEAFESGVPVWESRGKPTLAQVRHDCRGAEGTFQRLVLKWVETREYWAAEESPASDSSTAEEQEEQRDAEGTGDAPLSEEEPEASSQRVQVSVRHEERAVTFFVVDLVTGDCELRIQALRGHSRANRREQLGTYRRLVEDLLDTQLAGPLVLAPAIRRVLVAGEVPIVHCSAILPNGGRFTGGKGELPPVDLRALEAGLTVRFDWPQPIGGIGRIELDGRLDEIFILRPLVPEQHQLLLDRVRSWRAEELAGLSRSPVRPVGPVGTAPAAGRGEGLEFSGTEVLTILKAALSSGRPPVFPAPATIDPAIREYARTHAIEEAGQPAQPPPPGAPVPETAARGSAPDERALEQFLSYIDEVARSERSTFERELQVVRVEERWTFGLSIAAAVLALIFVAAGGVLMFTMDFALGTLMGVLGAVTGRGTVLIRSYAKNLKAKRETLQDRQRDSQETLLAIQAALSIAEPHERALAMSSVASGLLTRAG